MSNGQRGETTGPSVADAPHRHRYEITTDGELAGFAAYTDQDDQQIFYHTEIDERFAGRGLASKLVAAALADTRASEKRIVPVCPFVAKYVKNHHDFDDILDLVTPAALAAVRTTVQG
jgi:predicted GNAT family acetyltransferase